MLSNIITLLLLCIGITYLHDAIRGNDFKHIENVTLSIIATSITTLVFL